MVTGARSVADRRLVAEQVGETAALLAGDTAGLPEAPVSPAFCSGAQSPASPTPS